ncbi:cobalt ECF transporter T component CbiQ [Candidatus Omnitrophota bacterium]
MRHGYIDSHSGIGSFVHKLDPRVKFIATILLIISIVLTKPASYISFSLYGILIGLLIALSRIPIGFIFKRSLIVIPFVLVAAVFIPFIKKGEVACAYSFGMIDLTVTYEGLAVLWNVLIKSYLSVLCLILLISSTKFSNLLKALEGLRCPKIFIMILSFMYRYIFILMDELMRMKTAKDARSGAGERNWRVIRALANILGVLFVRAYERGERIYLAMCSRGFDGSVNTLNDLRLRAADVCFFVIFTASVFMIRSIGN